MSKLRAPSAETLRTACAVVALAMISAGAWMVYPPAGLIVPGVLILTACVAGALRSGR